jgi:death-on-curing protein
LPIAFLTLDEVLAIHARLVGAYGGSTGLRDRELLESALAMPQATYDGEFVHGSLAEMAAAYLFHLTKNHPFVDGNKRVGLACALVFVGLNDVAFDATEAALVDLVLGVVEGRVSKAEIAVFFEAHLRRDRPA